MFGTMTETFAIELSRDACFARLAEHRIGRLALSVNALPTIVPVRYVVIGHELLIGEVAEAFDRRCAGEQCRCIRGRHRGRCERRWLGRLRGGSGNGSRRFRDHREVAVVA